VTAGNGPRPAPANLWRIVTALGVSQIIAWGSLYYSIAVLAAPMRADLGLGETWVFGAFTVSLLLSGAVAPFVGRMLDRHGGRTVLPAGSLLGAAAFVILGTATGPVTYGIGWAVGGLAMGAGLYDAAFAALAVVAGAGYRRAVTGLTLWGGVASTVFWPLSQFLLEAVGWRHTLFVYAALHLLVCLPLYRCSLPRVAPPARAHPEDSTPAAAPAAPGFLWLAIAFASGSFIVSALGVHVIELLKRFGLTATQAIVVASLIGPMQVAGRVAEFVLARRLSSVAFGTIAFAMMLTAMVLLRNVEGVLLVAFVFVAIYGWSNGTMTIVRGTVPVELYGQNGYGELLGRLARPAFFARALAPAAFAATLSAGLTHEGAVTLLAGFAVVGLVCYRLAIRSARAATR